MRKLIFGTIIFILLSTCKLIEGDLKLPPLEDNIHVTEVTFTENSKNLVLRNLYKNNVALVMVNTSSSKVDADQTFGEPLPYANIPMRSNTATENRIIGHPVATRYHATPSIISDNRYLLRSPSSLAASNTIGDKHDFWVESVFQSGNFIQREAVLQAIGEHCKVWVIPNTDYSKTITRTQGETLAQKFDIIYPAETNLLGYEFGGGPNGSGGRDGDPKIQILVYDIGKYYGGYFWGKDYLTQPQLDAEGKGRKTNNAEMFYIGAELTNTYPDFIYSSLIHEFQHMINFNIKKIKNNITYKEWYDEMLSMMAEDVISSKIGIGTSSSGHVIQQRIQGVLYYYFLTGITEWLGDYFKEGEAIEEEFDYNIFYSLKYAYGAYLLRNYGGAAILKEIISNNLVNEASITAALNKAYGSGFDFQYTLKRFGEAFIYSGPLPRGAMSFDKTVTSTINGTAYTSYGFDIWKIQNPYPSAEYNMHDYFKSYGPFICPLDYWADRPRHSVFLFSHENFMNMTGDILITLYRPKNPNIKYLLMVF